MTTLRDIQISKSYTSDESNLLMDFYIPVLGCAKKYDRITGFFSPKILAVASRGFAQAIKNDVRIRIITSVKVDKDISTLSIEELASNIEQDLSTWDIDELRDELEKDYLKVFSYMLSNNLLEMKIAALSDEGILHQKIGIVTDDDGNSISFSGSNNETAYGWDKNSEEFKVFSNWNVSAMEYYYSDKRKFDQIWDGNVPNIKVLDLSDALKERIVSFTKTNEDIQSIIKRIKQLENPNGKEQPGKARQLRPYQEDAIQHWFNNNCNSIFAMATGTGKTFTTINALKRFKDTYGKINAIIAVPLRTLASQWQDEILNEFSDVKIVNTSDDIGWKNSLNSIVSNNRYLSSDRSFIVITTYSSFPNVLEYDLGSDLLLIADEMHNLATERGINAASSSVFRYKLGLSATPERLWKPSESAVLSQLFGDNRFEFGIEQALAEKCLVGYNYHPNFIELTNDEYEQYVELSRKIAKMAASTTDDVDDNYDSGSNSALNMELIKRSRIKKNAFGKIPFITSQLKELKYSSGLDRTLIYVDNEPFLDELQNAISSSRIITSRFLGDTPTQERVRIIDNLCSGMIDAIIAIKCLDEGVDIPSARQAFILSNGTDPREYVQRLGRVLRRDDENGKDHADVYDYIVLPPTGVHYMDDFERRVARNMVKNEIIRTDFFINLAMNKEEAQEIVDERMFALGFDFTDDLKERKEKYGRLSE